MSEHIRKTISDIVNQIKSIEDDLITKKKMVNNLCKMVNQPKKYFDLESDSVSSIFDIRHDQFFGRPLATNIKEYLNMRKDSNLGAATLEEIHDALNRGGYKFEKPKLALRGLSISMTKNSTTFVKLPNDTYGLKNWYPNIKTEKTSTSNNQTDDTNNKDSLEEEQDIKSDS